MTAAASEPRRDALLAALERGRARGARHVVASVPCPVAPAEALLGITGPDAVLWHAPDGAEIAGLGVAAELRAAGRERFRAIRDGARELFAGLGAVSEDGTVGGAAPAPRLLGGFAFLPGSASSEPWSGFGDAHFVLPRVGYARIGDTGWLTLAASRAEVADPATLEPWLDLAERAQDTLLHAARTRTTPPPRPLAGVRTTEEPEAAWIARIDAIHAAIVAGQVDKIVAARRVSLELGAPADPALVLARLRREAARTTRFGFRFGGNSFVGATPERLLEKHGNAVRTEALAGTLRSDDIAGRLLESAKDLAEHAFVVREITARLGPLVARIDWPEVPELRTLRHVLHLSTPIRAELREPMHVLDLVGLLHPTPAVGGVPSERALSWIAEHEPDARGWYAAPVGWLDAKGDGEFAVALRSGLLAGRSAHLWAGSGIVRGSDPVSELAETRLKLSALLLALEVAP